MVLVRTDILYNSVFWNWNLENRYTVKQVNLFFNFHLQSLGTLMCDFSLCYWSINRKLGFCACLPNLYTLNSSMKCTTYQISAYLKTKVLKETKKRKLPDFVEAGDDVAEVNPGRPRFCHLVKQVVPEKLQQVPVARFWPRWVLLESDWHNTRLCSCNRKKKLHYDAMFNKWYLLWTFIYGAQLGQQAKESAILHLLQKKQNRGANFICLHQKFSFFFQLKEATLKATPEEKNTLPLEAIAGSKIPHSLPTCSECCFKLYFHSCSCKQSIDVKCNEYGPNERGFKFDGWGREINK